MSVLSNKQFAFLVVVALALGVAAYFKSKRLIEVDLNPTHRDNYANRFAEYVYGGGFDGEGTIGTDLHDTVGWLDEYHPYKLADKTREAIKGWFE